MSLARGASLWLLLVLFCEVTFAQDPSASLEGQVADQTGGSIAGATVTITHEKTGLVRKQSSTDEGSFVFPVLPVGEYTLTVEKSEFAAFRQTAIHLNVNQTMRLNVVLDVAAAQQALSIEAKPNSSRPARTCLAT